MKKRRISQICRRKKRISLLDATSAMGGLEREKQENTETCRVRERESKKESEDLGVGEA